MNRSFLLALPASTLFSDHRLQELGGRIPEGQEIRMNTLPPSLICHHAGNLHDPEFNNSYLEILWLEAC